MSFPTPFGVYVTRKKLSPKEVAEQLSITRAYVHMLISGSQTPAFKLAWEIELWSDGAVTMQSWAPFLKTAAPQTPKKKPPRKKKA